MDSGDPPTVRRLHVATDSGSASSLREAIALAGLDEEVIVFPDDLSCGPIASNDPSARAAWWGAFFDWSNEESALRAFWKRIGAAEERLVVWFGQHSANQLAFFLAWADHLGPRPYSFVDVSDVELPYPGRDGGPPRMERIQTVFLLTPAQIAAMLGSERPAENEDRAKRAQRWRQLRDENAHFRIVTAAGLASAPIDHFDGSLLDQATRDWQEARRIVAHALIASYRPYFQVGDRMLYARLVALVERGELIAEGDLSDMRFCRVRLP